MNTEQHGLYFMFGLIALVVLLGFGYPVAKGKVQLRALIGVWLFSLGFLVFISAFTYFTSGESCSIAKLLALQTGSGCSGLFGPQKVTQTEAFFTPLTIITAVAVLVRVTCRR